MSENAEKFEKQNTDRQLYEMALNATAASYIAMFVLDMEDNTFTHVKSSENINAMIGKLGITDFRKALPIIFNYLTDPSSQKEVALFTDASTINERLKDVNNISIDYLSRFMGWCRATMIVMNRHEDGTIQKLLLNVENIEDARREYELQTGIINVLAENFTNILTVNVNTHAVRVYRTSGKAIAVDESLKTVGTYDDAFKTFVVNNVHEDDREPALVGCDFDNVVAHLRKEETFIYHFRMILDNVPHYYFMKAVRLGDAEKFETFVVGFACEDKEKEQERQALEQQKLLEKALVDAEQANKSKSTFLFNMSHDIRTPMNAILGFANLMGKAKDDPQKILEYSTKLKTAGSYLLELINGVLEMARIESGSIELHETPTSLFDIASQMGIVFNEEFRKKDLHTVRRISLSNPYVLCDSVKIQEILLNIASNAIKYTPEGGEIKYSLCDYPCDKSGYRKYVITIEDNGIGISKEFLPHVFDSFSREKSVTENRIKGTGLGMGITKKLVDLMGGDIQIESTLGEGTKITVTIELKTVEKSAISKKNDIIPDREQFLYHRVLLAEDNVLNREIAGEILKELGMFVDFVEDGVQCVSAIRHAKPNHYDLILMDIQMPNMDGLKATSVIRRMTDPAKANIPIIAMTANVFEEDRRKALNVGMNGFTSKPIETEKLYSEIAKVLGKKIS